MRKQEREALHKRIKEVLKKDPDLTLPQMEERFHVGRSMAMKLRKEALSELRHDF
jgi:hypothetical protein